MTPAPEPRVPARRRPRYGLLAAASALLLAAALLPWPGVRRSGAFSGVLAGLGAGGLMVSLMLWWSPGLLDTYPRHKTWRILLEAAPPLLLYMLALDRWPGLLAQVPAGGLRLAAACGPALLVLWAGWAFVRYLRLLDELQQRVELVSVALAAGVVCLLAASAGALHVAGMLQLDGKAGLWVFPLLAMAYALLRAALTRRYQ